MEKLLTSHQTAKLLNVWPQTLHRWEKEGRQRPLRTPGGHRRYKESQVMALIGEEPVKKESKRCAIYVDQHFQLCGIESNIVELDEERSPQEELVEDMIAIVTSFSARIYSKRGGRVAKKLVLLIEQEVAAGEDHS